MCGNCTQEKICNPFGSNKKVIELNNTINGHIGDIVIIEIIEKNRFLTTLLVFGLPTLLFVIGVICGQKIGGDKLAAIFAGAGLLIAFIIIKIVNNVLIKKGTDLVKIKENIHQQ